MKLLHSYLYSVYILYSEIIKRDLLGKCLSLANRSFRLSFLGGFPHTIIIITISNALPYSASFFFFLFAILIFIIIKC